MLAVVEGLEASRDHVEVSTRQVTPSVHGVTSISLCVRKWESGKPGRAGGAGKRQRS